MSAIVNQQESPHLKLNDLLETRDRQISENGQKLAQLQLEQKELKQRLNVIAEISEQNLEVQNQLSSNIEENSNQLKIRDRNINIQNERDSKIGLILGGLILVGIISTGIIFAVLKT